MLCDDNDSTSKYSCCRNYSTFETFKDTSKKYFMDKFASDKYVKYDWTVF